MFTGIVTHLGELATVREMPGGRELVVTSDLPLAELALGASLAHDGICLTVVAMEGRSHTVQASHETLARTTLGAWREGRAVNLERSLRLGDELGGHLVFGHVDAVGEILAIEPDGDCHRLDDRGAAGAGADAGGQGLGRGRRHLAHRQRGRC